MSVSDLGDKKTRAILELLLAEQVDNSVDGYILRTDGSCILRATGNEAIYEAFQ